MRDPLILASGSPRRRELLTELGLTFTVAAPAFVELEQSDWLSPAELALHNALGKAWNLRPQHPDRLILSADTVVALGSRVLGKPADQRQARTFLKTLSGRTHEVTTALALLLPGGKSLSAVTRTQVVFRELDAETIARYLAAVQVLDKAGGYAVQEQGDWIIERIDGSITNVIGLPVETLAKILSRI